MWRLAPFQALTFRYKDSQSNTSYLCGKPDQHILNKLIITKHKQHPYVSNHFFIINFMHRQRIKLRKFHHHTTSSRWRPRGAVTIYETPGCSSAASAVRDGISCKITHSLIHFTMFVLIIHTELSKIEIQLCPLYSYS